MKTLNNIEMNKPSAISPLGMMRFPGVLTKAACVGLLAMSGSVYADGLASDYDSIPPLLSAGGIAEKPNVLIMLDTSGSMDDNTGDPTVYVGANHKESRTVIARQAIARLMDDFAQTVNMGLMAFEPAPNFDYYRDWSDRGRIWSARSVGSSPNYQINRGYLYIPIGSIDPTDSSATTLQRLQDFDDRLGLSIVSQSIGADDYYDLFAFDNDYYINSTDYTNGRIPSGGGTPLEGTYLSALEYFQGDLPSSLYDPGISAADAVWPQNQCPGKDFAILITDGLPTVATSGEAGNHLVDTFVPLVVDQAKELLDPDGNPKTDDGVITYVIGFSLPSGAEHLNSIAVAGGTSAALFPNNLDELSTALNLIFTDIINRTSSGTGAAVIANRGSGLSADIQALYTPEKVLDGKTVKWVGTLQSIFVDDNNYFREDTNGDGFLSDYSTDRILEFEYDEATNTTLVHRMLSTSATDPTQADPSSAITSEIEDIASIWNARDQLASITDVLTQRSYTVNAGSGRRMYTSVDGQNLLDFVQVDQTGLEDLEDQEATLRSQIDALEDEIYGDVSTPADPYLLDDLNTLLDNLGTLIIQTDAIDGTGDGDLIDAVYALQQESTSVKSTVDPLVAAEESDLAAALALEQTELDELTQAQTTLSNEQTQLSAAQAVLDQANTDKATADQNVTDAEAALTAAETARDTADQALTDSQTAQATAQTDRDNAAATVTARETDVSNAEAAVTTETADRDAANTALTQATNDYNSAVTARDNAQTTYDSALTTAASEQADSDAAEVIRDQEQLDLDAAQTNYDDTLAFHGGNTSHPQVVNAQDELDQAQSEFDAADNTYQTEYQQWQDAEDDATTAQNTLTTAQNNVTTADINQSNAQAAYDQSVTDLATAESNLTAAESNLTAAESALTAAENTLTAANNDVTQKQTDLTAAETVVTDATTDRDNALTAQNDAATAVTDATTARDAEQADVDAATLDVASEQSDYDSAVTAREAVDTELARLNGILAELEAVDSWITDILSTVDSLNDLISQLNALGDADSTARDALIALITSVYNELQALITGVPAIDNTNSETTTFISQINALLSQIEIVQVVVNDSEVDPLDSIAESVANIDTKMTKKEKLESDLYDTDIQIDQLEYVRYMDDNIPSQAGDPDLSYAERSDVVAWIRGEEMTGLRNRTIDFDQDGNDEVWRLADIVHSTPAIVGRATEEYYTVYGDSTYRQYMREKYNRRQVVYVGSNDGVLHAFNSGFWDDAQKGYVTQLSGDSSVAHPLGAELWAYVPKAALPFLQFVADPGYSHMALMDGSPQVYDVNIFPSDADHPNGWGTILVVNMRMGGGEFTVRVDEDEDGTAEDVVIRPSVLIFDVTNPEVEPTLIAELTHPNLGFALSRPTLVKNRVASPDTGWTTPITNRWVLVFGSGPTDLDTATSYQDARIYAYDLNDQDWATDWSGEPLTVSLESNAFLGDLAAVDWDRNFVDDAVYFGVNTGTSAASDGQLARMRLRSDVPASWLSGADIDTLFDAQRSVLGAPEGKLDVYGNRWVYFGTGRLLVSADNSSIQQEYFAGVKEPVDTDGNYSYGSVSGSGLLDITDVRIYADPDKVESGPAGVETPSELIAYIQENNSGWYRELTYDGTDPSGRSDTRPVSFLDAIIFSEYIPSTDQCEPEGNSNLYLVNYMTGTAFKDVYLDKDSSTGEIMASIDVGAGKLGEMDDPRTGGNTAQIIKSSTGVEQAIEIQVGSPPLRRQSWRQIFDIAF